MPSSPSRTLGCCPPSQPLSKHQTTTYVVRHVVLITNLFPNTRTQPMSSAALRKPEHHFNSRKTPDNSNTSLPLEMQGKPKKPQSHRPDQVGHSTQTSPVRKATPVKPRQNRRGRPLTKPHSRETRSQTSQHRSRDGTLAKLRKLRRQLEGSFPANLGHTTIASRSA